ncbi:MAG: DUF2975 domain-containing protein [Gemmatimonadaceae bacterium]
MTNSSPNALSLSHRILAILSRLNLVAGAFILLLLIAGFIARNWVFTALGVRPPEGNESLILGMRAIMVAGLAAVAMVHWILSRLLAMVHTVRIGDPFVAENAERLKEIAWAVLGLEVLHAGIAAIAGSVSTPAIPLDIRWSFNLTRWLTVLLLFVLARVFEQGTVMREDLEGTV